MDTAGLSQPVALDFLVLKPQRWDLPSKQLPPPNPLPPWLLSRTFLNTSQLSTPLFFLKNSFPDFLTFTSLVVSLARTDIYEQIKDSKYLKVPRDTWNIPSPILFPDLSRIKLDPAANSSPQSLTTHCLCMFAGQIPSDLQPNPLTCHPRPFTSWP